MDTTKMTPEEAARRKKARQNAPEGKPEQRKRPQPDSAQAKAGGKRPAPEKQTEGKPRRKAEAPQNQAPQKRTPSRPEEAPQKRTAVKDAPRPGGAEEKQAAKKRKPQDERQRRASRQEEFDNSVANKKRAYGNSKTKKRSKLSVMTSAIRETAKESSEKRRAKREMKGRSPAHKAQQPAPAVIYTQPQAFNRNRLLIQLMTVTALVMAFVMGISVFFKVDTVRVLGADVYTIQAVEEASGIVAGDNLLTFSRARAGALIKANLPYVKNVSFGIKLPGTVNIIVEEDDVVYAIKDQVGQWWLINSDGRVVEQGDDRTAANYTQIQGVTIDHPLADQMAVATEMNLVAEEPEETLPEGQETEPAPMTVSGALRLTTAMHILKALEDNDIVGEAASVNVTQTESITLWYGTRYQVNLGNTANLDYKIACMVDVIGQLEEYQSGVLDISFTTWPNQVGYTPFA